MMDLHSDNFLKIQALENDKLLISRLIVENQPLNQSLEFAFLSRTGILKRFASDFATPLQLNT